ncbi:MAG: disulfide bond formation protein B [Candidatus Kaiserbacteria bacterium]|nr:disulfide bond formation protein B [Candidatus Kaiserbacteria bacterium]
MYPVDAINHTLALATLATQIIAIALLVLFFMQRHIPDLQNSARFIGRAGLVLGFLLTTLGLVITFFYSEVLGFTPCGLCWLARVFLYPQMLIFALALWKHDRGIADYSIALSVCGLAVSIYQHYLQMGGADILPCPTTITAASDCATRSVFELGYITFPLMGATLFAALIIVMLFVRSKR